ncbi:response regulator [Rufibacter sediminis]|nr:response regulator [Rufibacter sediminis]
MSLGKVLVIDYDEISCFLVERVMSRNGGTGQLSFAKHGKAALDLLEREVFDLILLEINSPFMEGAEFLRELDRLQERRGADLPKVVVVTSSVRHTFLEVPHHRIKGYLPKPFSDRHMEFLRALRQDEGIQEVSP